MLYLHGVFFKGRTTVVPMGRSYRAPRRSGESRDRGKRATRNPQRG